MLKNISSGMLNYLRTKMHPIQKPIKMFLEFQRQKITPLQERQNLEQIHSHQTTIEHCMS